jgi:hypothetical protein
LIGIRSVRYNRWIPPQCSTVNTHFVLTSAGSALRRESVHTPAEGTSIHVRSTARTITSKETRRRWPPSDSRDLLPGMHAT